MSLGSHGDSKWRQSEHTGSEELWENLTRHMLGEQALPTRRFNLRDLAKSQENPGESSVSEKSNLEGLSCLVLIYLPHH